MADQSDEAWRSLERVMRNREKCDPSCAFFSTCPAQPLSYLDDTRLCLMKLYGEPLRRTYLNLVLRGEDGLLDEMRRTLFQFARKVSFSDSSKDIRDYFELLSRFHKVLYGERGLLDTSPKEFSVNVKQIGHAVDPVTITDLEVPVNTEYVTDAQLCDPDSLFYNESFARLRSDKKTPMKL